MTAGSRRDRMTEPTDDLPAARTLRAAAEVVLLVLVAGSPWPFASAEPFWEFVLDVGLVVVLALWAAHAVVTRRFEYRSDAVSLCLLGLVLLTAVQLVPFPAGVVRVLSPTAAEWNQALRPAVPELLPGETEGAGARPRWMPLSIDPARTQAFLAQILAVFLVYAVARNFVASAESFRRLAWVAYANGLLLALVGLTQFFAGGKQVIYGVFDMQTPVFGPFVCKNHYPYYVNLCIGLGLGLLGGAVRRAAPVYRDELAEPARFGGFDAALSIAGELLRSPRALGLLGGIGLMLASIPFSLSRGGLIAMLAAAAVTVLLARFGRRTGTPNGVGLLAAVLGLFVLGLVGWFGAEPVRKRLATFGNGANDDRLGLWGQLWPAAVKFPFTGTGGGTLPRADFAFRTTAEAGVTVGPNIVVSFAHNEYLEAAVEGGLVRVALTLGLVAAVLGTAAVGYRRLHRRSVGPLLLGAVFGLTAVAVHSAADFGFHMPAIALFTTVVAAQVMATADDPGHPERRRRRRGENRQTAPQIGAPAAPTGAVLLGGGAYTAAAVVVIAGLIVALTGWRLYRVADLRLAADWVIRGYTDMDRWDAAIKFAEATTRIRPADAETWNELAALHLAAARERGMVAAAAVVGPLAFARPPDAPLVEDISRHVIPALAAARTARDRCPLLVGPHLRLGTHAHVFARSEPVGAHLARAKRVGGYDADVWYLCGAAELAAGNRDAAWEDWRESLRRSADRLGPVVRQAARHLKPEDIRSRVLPDDPAAWIAAAAYMDLDPETRRAWLRHAADKFARGTPSHREDDFVAWIEACEELGDAEGALKAARMAAERFPDSVAVRDRLSARLEAEEDYAAAIPQLEWLATQRPNNPAYPDRLAAARHALKLAQDIGGK